MHAQQQTNKTKQKGMKSHLDKIQRQNVEEKISSPVLSGKKKTAFMVHLFHTILVHKINMERKV